MVKMGGYASMIVLVNKQYNTTITNNYTFASLGPSPVEYYYYDTTTTSVVTKISNFEHSIISTSVSYFVYSACMSKQGRGSMRLSSSESSIY